MVVQQNGTTRQQTIGTDRIEPQLTEAGDSIVGSPHRESEIARSVTDGGGSVLPAVYFCSSYRKAFQLLSAVNCGAVRLGLVIITARHAT